VFAYGWLICFGFRFYWVQDATILGPAIHVIMLGSILCREREKQSICLFVKTTSLGIFRHRNENSMDIHVEAKMSHEWKWLI